MNSLLQKVVSFHGDQLIGVQAEDGTVFAPFNRLCENLGLQRAGQAQRIQRHAVLNDALVTLTIETPGGPQPVQCLRIDVLPLWLSGVQASRVKEELREKLIRYQKEAAVVLWQAFKPQILVEPDDTLAPSTDAELVQLAEMGRAITRMAEEQLEIRRRLDAAARAFQGIRHDITDVQVRLGVLEDKLHPAAYITDAQAAEVSNQ